MDLSSHHWHFVGIGGAGMSALADALLDLGANVSGSDAAPSDVTRSLAARGARVHIGHDAANAADATRVVVTAALAEDNPEVLVAQERGIPVIKRAQLLGELMQLRRGVAVAGTHGKTTTSAMIAWVLSRAGRDPSYMVGGTIRGLGPGGHWGTGPELVAEADEYDRSFLHLHPDIAIITNIESDHLEYYGSEEAIWEAFAQFASNVRPGGLLLYIEDPSTLLDPPVVLLASNFRVQCYGFESIVELHTHSTNSYWWAGALTPNAIGGTDYVAFMRERPLATVSLQVPGRHNVLNSLAALAACTEVGLEPHEIAQHLSDFQGAGRRFEVKGEAEGITVVDDYAHHPTEIAATIQAAHQRYQGRRLVVVFQPHTYTRTRDFLDDFGRVLTGADFAIITEIYASREHDTLGMSGQDIEDRITGIPTAFAPTLDDAIGIALGVLRSGDVLITMGAGDVWKVGDSVLRHLR